MKTHLFFLVVILGVLWGAMGSFYGQEKTIDLTAEFDLSLEDAPGDVS